jgi:RNA polymerase sigma-70 factor, ECF subfamily
MTASPGTVANGPPAHDVSGTAPALWVERYGDFLFRCAVARVRSVPAAEDLVQETFLAALKSQRAFRGEAPEKSWLAGILMNKIADYFRRQARERSFTDLEFLAEEHGDRFRADGKSWVHKLGPKEWVVPEESLERKEFWVVLHHCCSKLPALVAQVYLLRELDGKTTQEICDLVGVSPNHSAVMLHRARLALRRCLERHWFANGAERTDSPA